MSYKQAIGVNTYHSGLAQINMGIGITSQGGYFGTKIMYFEGSAFLPVVGRIEYECSDLVGRKFFQRLAEQ